MDEPHVPFRFMWTVRFVWLIGGGGRPHSGPALLKESFRQDEPSIVLVPFHDPLAP